MTTHTSPNLTVDAVVEGVHLKFETEPRLFSPQGIDEGTASLLTHVHFHENDKVLDLGCGYGVIGIYATKRIDPKQVFLVDNDPAAVSCAMRNAQLNAVESVHIQCSEGFRGLSEKDFTKILCNPPYHADFAVAKHLKKASTVLWWAAPLDGNQAGRLVSEQVKKHFRRRSTHKAELIYGF